MMNVIFWKMLVIGLRLQIRKYNYPLYNILSIEIIVIFFVIWLIYHIYELIKSHIKSTSGDEQLKTIDY